MSCKLHNEEQNIALPKKPWSTDVETLFGFLEVDWKKGFAENVVKKRSREYGSNRIAGKKRKSVWSILLNQFESVIVLLLTAAALATFSVGRWVEGIAIGVVVVFNSLIGFITELRAIRSMEALAKLSQSMSKIRRSSHVRRYAHY